MESKEAAFFQNITNSDNLFQGVSNRAFLSNSPLSLVFFDGPH